MRLLALLLLCPGAVFAQTCTGFATLSWNPPTMNTDGSDLTDLAGFVVYWGSSQGTYASQTYIDDPAATTYVVDQLCAGTWYFVATAFNTGGFESAYSNEATKTILGTALSLKTIGGSLYAQAFTKDALGMIAVGTVPMGIPCDPNQYVKAFGVSEVRYVVPGLGYQQAVVAACSMQ